MWWTCCGSPALRRSYDGFQRGDLAVHVAKRKELAAYYTPVDLARYLARWAITTPSATVLEPSVGGGALVSAALERLDAASGGRVVGCEIDQETYWQAKARFEASSVTLLNADFLDLAPTAIRPVDAVLANPPFTRNHRLSVPTRRTLRSRAEFRNIVSGAPGLWVYFVLASLQFLKLGARLAFVVPRTIEFAAYATPLIGVLKERFQTVTLLDVEGTVDWEGAAEERAALVLAAGFGMGPAPEIRNQSLSLTTGETSDVSGSQKRATLLPATLLGNLADVEIGVVTGANAAFVLDEAHATENELPWSALIPIVSRARQVRGLEISKQEARSMAKKGERTLLFLPKSVGSRNSSVRKYIQKIADSQTRQICWFSKRDPWWQVRIGRDCDAVFTYMNNTGPRIILTPRGLVCTNTLHRVRFKNRDPAHARTVSVTTLTSFTQLEAERVGRIYGGGVLKFELKDARRLRLLVPPNPVSVATFKRLDATLRAGELDFATRIADEVILPQFFGSKWPSIQSEMLAEIAALRSRRGISHELPKRGAVRVLANERQCV